MKPTAQFADISHYEPVNSFHDYKDANHPLLITKATEGTGYTDPTYADYAKRVRSVPGLILGAYVFEDVGNAKVQNDHFFSVTHLQKGDLQPILDAEAAGLSKTQTLNALIDMENRGYRPILYASLSFFYDVLGAPTKWWLWLAAYRSVLPSLHSNVKLFAWQHTDHGTFPGIPNPCDGSYLYVPVANLKTEFCLL